VEESEWINPTVIQSKDTEDIRVSVDFRSFNATCMHDPFPTPFNDEVLDQVAGKEAYSFTDGFFEYRHIIIAKEEKKKTKLTIE
jgi:hypothetical protein